MLGMSGWELIVNIVITWTIGLLPPLLLRYVILRRPVKQGTAVAIASLFFVGNLVLAETLGSESKAHPALMLVWLVSYWILMRPARIRLSSPAEQPAASASAPEESTQEFTRPTTDSGGHHWWTRRRRRVAAWSALASAVLALSASYVDWRNNVHRAKYAEQNTSYEAQARRAIKNQRSGVWIEYSFEDGWSMRDAGTFSSGCVAALEKVEARAPDVDPSVLATAASECGFSKPFVASTDLRDHPRSMLRIGLMPLIGAVVGIGVAALILWPLGYPHPGWRRVAVVAGPTVFLLALMIGYQRDVLGDGPEFWIGAAIAGLLAPAVTLLAVRLYAWLKAGFVT